MLAPPADQLGELLAGHQPGAGGTQVGRNGERGRHHLTRDTLPRGLGQDGDAAQGGGVPLDVDQEAGHDLAVGLDQHARPLGEGARDVLDGVGERVGRRVDRATRREGGADDTQQFGGVIRRRDPQRKISRFHSAVDLSPGISSDGPVRDRVHAGHRRDADGAAAWVRSA